MKGILYGIGVLAGGLVMMYIVISLVKSVFPIVAPT